MSLCGGAHCKEGKDRIGRRSTSGHLCNKKGHLCFDHRHDVIRGAVRLSLAGLRQRSRHKGVTMLLALPRFCLERRSLSSL